MTAVASLLRAKYDLGFAESVFLLDGSYLMGNLKGIPPSAPAYGGGAGNFKGSQTAGLHLSHDQWNARGSTGFEPSFHLPDLIQAPSYRTELTADMGTKKTIKSVAARMGHADQASLMLAIAMQEDKTLNLQYKFGDEYPNHVQKTGDSANFGPYKMNWYMIQQLPSAKRLLSLGWIGAGVIINLDRALATELLIEAFENFSLARPDGLLPELKNFWAGHRWAESGFTNQPPSGNTSKTMWDDILNYYLAVQVIRAYIDQHPDEAWDTPIRYGMDVNNV